MAITLHIKIKPHSLTIQYLFFCISITYCITTIKNFQAVSQQSETEGHTNLFEMNQNLTFNLYSTPKESQKNMLSVNCKINSEKAIIQIVHRK